MEKQLCGKCAEEVTGIEPAVCGLCDVHYHIGRECSGITRTEMNLFTKGVAIWLCPNCRAKFGSTNIHGLIKKLVLIESLQTQVAELTLLVNQLGKKIENKPFNFGPNNQRSTPNAEERPITKSTKRRRGADGEIHINSVPQLAQGTRNIDLSNLSVPSITPEEPKPRFWLYLTGFHPQVSNDDITKIVSRSLDYNDAFDVVKLVSKDTDLSKLSFVSFKIGLDPCLKQKALLASTWPQKVKFREFQNFTAKNAPITQENETNTLAYAVPMDQQE